MKLDELHFLSAAELRRLVRQKEVSPVEIVDAHLKRVESLEPKLNSFITVAGEKARDAARTAENELAQGIRSRPPSRRPSRLERRLRYQGA